MLGFVLHSDASFFNNYKAMDKTMGKIKSVDYAPLIKMFNVCIVDDTCAVNPEVVNEYAMSRGYVVHPDVCNEHVLKFVKEVAVNPNATFYKTVEDVVSKNRYELLIDQIVHYMTTYGTDFSLGNGFVPNDMDFSEVPDWTQFKAINPISESELYDKCVGMLVSGIALNKNTMTALADYVIAYCMDYRTGLDIDSIRNREAQVYICDRLGIFPRNPMALFRLIMLKTTGDTMVVKNNETFKKISYGTNTFDMSVLDDGQVAGLSTLFYRFKMLFCALKKNHHSNGPVVNKIRKLAVRNHKPLAKGFWQTVFDTDHTEDELKSHIGELTAYRKVSLLNLCNRRMRQVPMQMYTIRNRKTFIRENYCPQTSMDRIGMLSKVLTDSIVDTLRRHSTKTVVDEECDETTRPAVVPVVVRTARDVTVPLPVSEKAFIGNYPCGTRYRMTENNFIGCYWRNEWGTNDYDLSFLDENGRKIGWNSSYYDDNHKVVFSGDMTNAEPEATELLFVRKECPNGFVTVNQYSGNSKSKFRMIFGQENIEHMHSNYMVDPNSIRLDVEIEHENCRDISVGIVNADSFTLINTNNGNSAVSRYGGWTSKRLDSLILESGCYADSVPLLEAAGFRIVGPDYDGEVDIDFGNLSKDSLIGLMAE